MSKRDDHLRKAENLLAGADAVIPKLTEVFSDIPDEELLATSAWFNTLASVARAHTALAEHYALWENDNA